MYLIMKKAVLFSTLIIFSSSIFAQLNGGRQVRPRINISASPYVEYIKAAGKMNFASGMNIISTINDKFYYGFYVTKKIQRNYINYGDANGELDFSHQHYGITVGRYFGLGSYRSKGGRYLRRETKLSGSLKIGHAVFWTVNKEKEKVSNREYFYLIQPSVAGVRPLGGYISVALGITYPLAIRIDQPEWEPMNISNKQFSGPGAYFSVQFNLFHAGKTKPSFFL